MLPKWALSLGFVLCRNTYCSKLSVPKFSSGFLYCRIGLLFSFPFCSPPPLASSLAFPSLEVRKHTSPPDTADVAHNLAAMKRPVAWWGTLGDPECCVWAAPVGCCRPPQHLHPRCCFRNASVLSSVLIFVYGVRCISKFVFLHKYLVILAPL